MGLTLCGWQIAKELDMNKDDARAMIQHLRQGIVDRRPRSRFPARSNATKSMWWRDIRGIRRRSKKREGRATPTPERGTRPRDSGEGEAADLRDVAARRRGRDPDVGERQAGDDRPLDRSDDSQGDSGVHR